MGNHQTQHIAILACLQTGSPTILISDPGLGKTRYINSIADAAGRFMTLVIGSQCDQTDFGGIPYVDKDGKMRRSIPWFIQDILDQDRPAVILYDEVSNTPRSVAGSMLNGIQTGRFGAGQVPEGTWQPMAMNPVDTATDGTPLTPAFSNRAYHFKTCATFSLQSFQQQ
jgi:MoxR-like ATPase